MNIIIGRDAAIGELYKYWETLVFWCYSQFAHMLICGPTGSDKTYALKSILYNLFTTTGTTLWLCDFKNQDFRFAEDAPRYYGFKNVAAGLNDFYQAFEARQSGADTSEGVLLLVFDEWGAYLSTLDKKQAEAEKAKLSTLLMLGRSFNVHVIVSQQRADAEYFAKARDNFGAILGMGTLSKEAKEMLFSEVKDEMKPVEEIGIGHFLQGSDLRRIWVPSLAQVDSLNAAILEMVTR